MDDLSRRIDEADIEPAPDASTKDDPHPGFHVNNKQLKLVRRLFSSASDEEGQGQVRWDDIVKVGYHVLDGQY